MSATAPVVAVIGTGRMGSAMARALARAGITLVLHNRTRDRATTLASELGARVAETPGQAAALADICLTMLADDAAVGSVYRGPDGLIAAAKPGSLLVDLSTVTPDTIRSFDADARAGGRRPARCACVRECRNCGGWPAHADGRGRGGRPGAGATCPGAAGKAIVHVGPLGSGAAMKLAVNTVIFGLNEALAEGLVLAEIGRDRSRGRVRRDRGERGRGAVRRVQASLVHRPGHHSDRVRS